MIEAVWGYESDLGYDRTVDVHMRRLRQKLEDDPANPAASSPSAGSDINFSLSEHRHRFPPPVE